jgi:RimJ/RimL family protein N-acetyltransferase
MELQTENLTLVLPSTEEVLARIQAMSPADQAQVSPDWVARLRAAPEPDPWTHGFSILHRASGETVGSCGYKGLPDSNGVVEIAYGVDAAYQGHGYATEAARALVAHAFEQDGVRLVIAHTLPEPNASGRVLTKCGFKWRGGVVDPEDGPVWRWEFQSAGATAVAADGVEEVPEVMLALLVEILRIAPDMPVDTGLALPQGAKSEEFLLRLQEIPDGAGIQSLVDVLNSLD